MKVHVKLLNVYRKYLPDDAQGATYSLEVATGTWVEELLKKVPVPDDESQVVLVNGHTPLAEQVLKDGDTIAIFPAMAGG